MTLKIINAAVLVAYALPALASSSGSPCASMVELTNEPQDLSSTPRLIIQPGEYVCWKGSDTQKVMIGDSAHYSFDKLPGEGKSGEQLGGVRGMAGYSTMVHVEDVKDGRRVTFFVHTNSVQSKR